MSNLKPGVTITYADRFEGDSSDDDSPALGRIQQPALGAAPAPAAEPSSRLSGSLSGFNDRLARSTPSLPSQPPLHQAIPTSTTFTVGVLPKRQSLVERLQATTESAIQVSLSMHDVSIYGRMLASTDALPRVREHLLSTSAAGPTTSAAGTCSPPVLPATASRAPAVETLPLTVSEGAHIFFSVVKSYVGPAILYLPHAFLNGGMLFSLVVVPVLGVLTTASFYHLALCHIHCAGHPTYGDLGALALGRAGRYAVQAALALAQLAACTSYYMFVAANVRDSASRFGASLPPDHVLIPLLLPVFAPLTMLPKLRHLALTNILADFLILGGLSFVAAYALAQLSDAADPAQQGEPIVWLQPPSSFLLFIGTACFTFEGGGLMIPIAASLEPNQKEHFKPLFLQAMVLVTFLFTGFGALGYACFGGAVLLPVTLNVHSGAVPSAALRIGYSLAVVCTYPLQLMPISDMVEGALAAPPFHLVQPTTARRLLARFALMALTCTVAVIGASQFDHFVSLVGVLCGTPLSFILPSLIYLRLCDELGIATHLGRTGARVAIVLASAAMVAGTFAVLSSWNSPQR